MRLPTFYWLIAFVAATYVWLDGRRIVIERDGRRGRPPTILVAGWSIATFFLPIVFLPLWFWRRSELQPADDEPDRDA